MRPKARPLTAERATSRRTIVLPNMREWNIEPGDWMISNGTQVVDVMPNEEFTRRYEPVVEGLTVPAQVCRQIEDTTGIGTTRTPAALADAVARLARIAIGNQTIPFTPGQLEEIKHRASKRGISVKQEIARIVERVKEEIFFRS